MAVRAEIRKIVLRIDFADECSRRELTDWLDMAHVYRKTVSAPLTSFLASIHRNFRTLPYLVHLGFCFCLLVDCALLDPAVFASQRPALIPVFTILKPSILAH